ncbi:eCIS core domain-containing protein [Variovorax saccharolyticus]|uniref:eCIS core domain-containing protein n=1 Tax=Variovorax saccharolyticus TaxID=3053516 RepID=UPI0025757C31|nr:DUF4157 domain-containing protein [Variovorax sp. J31P216]MDM0030037.1 DUF4157 domain-containing protein [Variovorax sp. J31P216]
MKTLRQRRTPARATSRPSRPAIADVHDAEVAERNRAAVAQALAAPVQTKLRLGGPGDAQELEADRIAAHAMGPVAGADPQQLVQRKCSDCAQEDKLQRKPTEAPAPGQEEERKVDELQRKATGEAATGGTVADATASAIHQQRGSGTPLPGSERSFFEPRIGVPLDQVRVHADAPAARLAGELGARAFTVGRDVFFGAGEYRPGSFSGRWLMAHELAHVALQGQGVVRRWNIGAAPAPLDWEVVADAEQLRRLGQAEGIVRAVLGSRNCQNFFTTGCGGANALRNAFDNANVYLRPHDDNVFGERTGNNIAFNLRSFRIGRFMIASTLLHEMFHTCDPTVRANQNQRELNSENAVEACRLHTPWIDTVAPRSAAAGTSITILGWGFGPTQGGADSVQIGGVGARVVSWNFTTDTSSRVEIVAEVPAGVASGSVVVINNGVRSNVATIRVT